MQLHFSHRHYVQSAGSMAGVLMGAAIGAALVAVALAAVATVDRAASTGLQTASAKAVRPVVAAVPAHYSILTRELLLALPMRVFFNAGERALQSCAHFLESFLHPSGCFSHSLGLHEAESDAP
jgi:hypothetical protein